MVLRVGLSPVLQDLIRRHSVLTIKAFGSKYKITWCKSSRKKGCELLNCDIDDEEFGISDDDKAFTRSFYKEDN